MSFASIAQRTQVVIDDAELNRYIDREVAVRATNLLHELTQAHEREVAAARAESPDPVVYDEKDAAEQAKPDTDVPTEAKSVGAYSWQRVEALQQAISYANAHPGDRVDVVELAQKFLDFVNSED